MKQKKPFRRDHVESRQPRRYPVQVNMDILASMQDSELIRLLDELYDGKNEAYQHRHPVRDWEVEIAYIRREIQIRQARKQAHEAYVHGMMEENARVRVEQPGTAAGEPQSALALFTDI